MLAKILNVSLTLWSAAVTRHRGLRKQKRNNLLENIDPLEAGAKAQRLLLENISEMRKYKIIDIEMCRWLES